VAIILYALLAIVAGFLLIAAIPTLTETVEVVREDFAERGWVVIFTLGARVFAWLLLAAAILYLSMIGGMFLP
jgi:hypothetical protein